MGKDNKILRKIEKEREKAERQEEKEKMTMKDRMREFKDFCVKDTARMVLLIAILVVAYMVLNLLLQNKQLAQIDLTEGKIHSLTDRSKDIAKSVNKEIDFYLWGISDNDAVTDIIRQYNRENDLIKLIRVSSDDVETIQKYNFEEGYSSIIATCGKKTSYIDYNDFYSYDDNLNQVDLTEQKLTNTLVHLNNEKTYKVYFLEGRTEYSVEDGVYMLSKYLEAENYEVGTINVIADPTIPEDCDIIAIMGLKEDLTSTEAENICQFIEKGGDLVVTNDVDVADTTKSMPQFNRVLQEYCMSMPNMLVYENDPSKQVLESLSGIAFQGTLNYTHEITRLLAEKKTLPIMVAAGAIELDYTTWSEKMVDTAVPLITTSTLGTVSDLSTNTTNSEESTYTVAAAAEKTASNGQKSRIVVVGSTGSFSDTQFFDKEYTFCEYSPNNSFIMNSFAYVSNQGELYSIRKTSSISYFTVTKKQDVLVRIVIVGIPALVVCTGIFIFIKRRKLK